MADLKHPVKAVDLSIEDEAALVLRVKAGEQAACTELVTRFAPRMMTIARRFMRCEADCNDALQDAFLSAFNALARFRFDSRLSTWLHRITVNACLGKLRKDASRRETSIENLIPIFDQRGVSARRPVDVNDPSKEIETEEARALILQAINELPQPDRAVLLLRDIEEMDIAATAARLNTTRHNVARRLRRARQSLRTRLEPVMAGERTFVRV